MFNWDDIKLFLSVKDTGSLVRTAKRMNMAHSTAYRRLKAFEKSVGARLFESINGEFVLSESGEKILPYALDMADRSEQIARHIVGKDYQLSGPIRVTTTHGLSLYFMDKIFQPFHQQYPDIQLRVQWGDQVEKLNRFESDVIILPSKSPPDNAFGRKAGSISFRLFASQDYLKNHGKIAKSNIAQHSFVQLDHHFAEQAFYKHFSSIAASGQTAITCNSFLTAREAISSGLGIGVLPSIYASEYKSLVMLEIYQDTFNDNDLWILTHKDLQNTVRIRTFMDFAYKEIQRLKRAL